MLPSGRVSGVLLPLFSLRSRSDFGIGDFGALPSFFDWMTQAKQRVLMLLPLLPTSPGDSSPYACRSAFGLNPLFLDLHQIPEFTESGAEASLPTEERDLLGFVRAAPSVQYDKVWQIKSAVLWRAFLRFESQPQVSEERAAAFAHYADSQPWLSDYALYTALSEQQNRRAFWDWPKPLRDRHPDALEVAKADLARPMRYAAWLQWQCHLQWQKVRSQALQRGIYLCGDEPFTVGKDSADAWAHPQLLRQDARLGVPPDDFSSEGQDWGLPWFDFDTMEKEGFAWFKNRAKHAAEFYDFRRVDHAIGYFRQWIREPGAPRGHFVPDQEAAQLALGQKLFALLSQDAGVVAEDLGLIPPFAKRAMDDMNLPGYRVMRWERFDNQYRNPQTYPALSLVTTGTHDTEPLANWWENETEWLRNAAADAWPELAPLRPVPRQFTPDIHEALLKAALHAPSALCIFPWSDIFGTKERINTPGTVSADNWTHRINLPVEDLSKNQMVHSRTEWLAKCVEASGRN